MPELGCKVLIQQDVRAVTKTNDNTGQVTTSYQVKDECRAATVKRCKFPALGLLRVNGRKPNGGQGEGNDESTSTGRLPIV